MAQEDIARLVAVLEANVNNFTKNMDRARRIADREFGTIERRMRRTERSFAGFGGRGLNTLVSRYLSVGAAITAVQRLVRLSIEENDQAAASWARLDETLKSIAEKSGPLVSAFFDELDASIKQDVSDIEKLIAVLERLEKSKVFGPGGAIDEWLKRNIPGWKAIADAADKMGQLPGVNIPVGVAPLQPGWDKSATFNKSTGNWRPSPGGFPVSGVTDVTPGQDRELEEALRFGEELAEMARRMQADRIESEEETQQRLLADALAYGEELLADARQLAAERIAIEEETQQRLLEDALEYGEQWNEEIRQLTADRINAQLEEQAARIAEIGDAFEYLGHAAFQGGEAFKRALAQMAQSLALSGLRTLFEGLLNSLSGGGGFLASAISGRASGGRVDARTPYIVGERGPEIFNPDTSGTIIPRLPTANAVAGARAMSVDLRQTIDLRGANGDATIAAIARQAASEGTLIAVNTIRKQFPQLMIKAQRDSL